MRITLALASSLLALSGSAVAAERTYSVTTFDKVRVEGPFAVTLTTGVAPFARASGSQRGIDAISVRVEGQVLTISSNVSNWGGNNSGQNGPVTITVGTHELTKASVGGTGSIAIDRVRGLEFAMTIVGAGQGSVDRLDVDRLTLGLAGTGSARVAGRAGRVEALVKGAANLDAAGLQIKDITLVAQGPATAAITASSSAKINAAGTAVVTVAGSPACTLKVLGSATVSGCR